MHIGNPLLTVAGPVLSRSPSRFRSAEKTCRKQLSILRGGPRGRGGGAQHPVAHACGGHSGVISRAASGRDALVQVNFSAVRNSGRCFEKKDVQRTRQCQAVCVKVMGG